MKKLPALLAILAAMPFARALEIQGVTVPPTVQVSGQNLPLNGAGLRTFTLLLVPIKIYVAAFYTPGPLRSETEVLASPGPMQFNFTFLRAVGASDVAEAWTSQFANSITYTYPGYQKDRDSFIGMFGALKSGGVQMVQFVGTDTIIYDQGTLKGTIAGRDFQKAFLSLWFGSNPVASDLKAALLGKSGS
jgi:hypothetical protein